MVMLPTMQCRVHYLELLECAVAARSCPAAGACIGGIPTAVLSASCILSASYVLSASFIFKIVLLFALRNILS